MSDFDVAEIEHHTRELTEALAKSLRIYAEIVAGGSGRRILFRNQPPSIRVTRGHFSHGSLGFGGAGTGSTYAWEIYIQYRDEPLVYFVNGRPAWAYDGSRKQAHLNSTFQVGRLTPWLLFDSGRAEDLATWTLYEGICVSDFVDLRGWEESDA